jgi:hypothetical protein
MMVTRRTVVGTREELATVIRAIDARGDLRAIGRPYRLPGEDRLGVELELLEPARFTPTRTTGRATNRPPYHRPQTGYPPRPATARLGRRTRRRRVPPYLLVAAVLAALAALAGIALAVVWFVHWIAAHAAVILGLLAMAGIGLLLASGGAGGCCVDLIKRCGH